MVNRCVKCHRPLKGDQSVKRGMGRTCFIKTFGVTKRIRKNKQLTGHDWEQAGLFDGGDVSD